MRRPQNPKRPGFTLLELLVVIAIIAVLASLVASGTMDVIAGQKQANTETLLRTLDKTLSQQVKAVIDKANKETITTADSRVDWINKRLQQEFPTSSSELAPSGLNALATYDNNKTAINGLTDPNATIQSNMQASAWLMLSLSRNRGGGSWSPDLVGSGYIARQNGQAYFVDGWGRPITFQRPATFEANKPYQIEIISLGRDIADGNDNITSLQLRRKD